MHASKHGCTHAKNTAGGGPKAPRKTQQVVREKLAVSDVAIDGLAASVVLPVTTKTHATHTHVRMYMHACSRANTGMRNHMHTG